MVKHRLFILMANHEIRTMSELANRTGLKYRTLVNFATYKSKMLDPQVIVSLCILFDCCIDELLYLQIEEVI